MSKMKASSRNFMLKNKQNIFSLNSSVLCRDTIAYYKKVLRVIYLLKSLYCKYTHQSSLWKEDFRKANKNKEIRKIRGKIEIQIKVKNLLTYLKYNMIKFNRNETINLKVFLITLEIHWNFCTVCKIAPSDLKALIFSNFSDFLELYPKL